MDADAREPLTALTARFCRIMRLSRDTLSAASHRYSCELEGEAVEAVQVYELHDVRFTHKYLDEPIVCSVTIMPGGVFEMCALRDCLS